MGTSTPAQFAAKLSRVVHAVQTQQPRALEARAVVTKQSILAAALRRTKKAKPGWVRYKIVADVAEIRLRGGLGHLIELGSHKHPEGWDETPKGVSARRIRTAAKAGRTLSQHKALNTPYGPKASVHHPAVAAKPFWEEGLVASREPGKKAYQKVVDTTITAAMR